MCNPKSIQRRITSKYGDCIEGVLQIGTAAVGGGGRANGRPTVDMTQYAAALLADSDDEL